MSKAHFKEWILVVCCIAMAPRAGMIKSISVDSVKQDSIGHLYRISGALPIQMIEIEPATYDNIDSAIPSPSIRYAGVRPALSFATVSSMTERLFNSIDSMPDCCTRDRIRTSYRFYFTTESVTLSFDSDGGGCPFETLEGKSGLVCTVARGKYFKTILWQPGDSIIYSVGVEQVVIQNASASNSVHPVIATGAAPLAFTNTAIRRIGSTEPLMQITIRNVRGEVVRSFGLSGRQPASIEDLDAGLYFCQATTKGGAAATVRFVKTK